MLLCRHNHINELILLFSISNIYINLGYQREALFLCPQNVSLLSLLAVGVLPPGYRLCVRVILTV